MDSIETLATFFGWCIVINFGALLLVVLVFSLFHDIFATLSAKVFGITKEEAAVTFFRVVQQYRFALMVLNIAPYIALKIMS